MTDELIRMQIIFCELSINKKTWWYGDKAEMSRAFNLQQFHVFQWIMPEEQWQLQARETSTLLANGHISSHSDSYNSLFRITYYCL